MKKRTNPRRIPVTRADVERAKAEAVEEVGKVTGRTPAGAENRRERR